MVKLFKTCESKLKKQQLQLDHYLSDYDPPNSQLWLPRAYTHWGVVLEYGLWSNTFIRYDVMGGKGEL